MREGDLTVLSKKKFVFPKNTFWEDRVNYKYIQMDFYENTVAKSKIT